MSRQFDMCDVCKLDKNHICDYKCIKQRSDFLFRFYTCPNFIYDDGKPITNAEWVSTLLKSDVDVAARELWDQVVLNEGCIELNDFKEWLQSNAEICNEGECD